MKAPQPILVAIFGQESEMVSQNMPRVPAPPFVEVQQTTNGGGSFAVVS
jgi:hypothetical protein